MLQFHGLLFSPDVYCFYSQAWNYFIPYGIIVLKELWSWNEYLQIRNTSLIIDEIRYHILENTITYISNKNITNIIGVTFSLISHPNVLLKISSLQDHFGFRVITGRKWIFVAVVIIVLFSLTNYDFCMLHLL